MLPRKAALGFAIAILVTSVACSSDESIAPSSATGNWSGAFSNFGTASSLNILLLDKTGTVTGNGTFTSGTASFAVNVTGTFVSPTFSATVNAPGFVSMNFTAILSGQSLTGVLNGSGFSNQQLVLVRQ